MLPLSRNAKVVVTLVISVSLGTGVLLSTEPEVRQWSSPPWDPRLASPPRSVEIAYIAPQDDPEPAGYDCVIYPDREPLWRPTGQRVRVGVVGTDDPRLPREQARRLLAVLGGLRRIGLDVLEFQLAPGSDARLHPELPPQAHDLCALLTRKGIVR